MRRYDRPAIERFFRAIDAALTSEHRIVVVGGAAVVLGCGEVPLMTRDIDYAFDTSGAGALEVAARAAREVTGLPIPLDHASLANGPYGLEERLTRVLPDLVHLAVWLPERHDLALMKVIRGAEADIAGLLAVHREIPFDYGVLVTRYEEEMGAVAADPGALHLNMLQLVEALFPDELMDAEVRLSRARARRERLSRPGGGPGT
jgi:hypothetical protein